MKRYLRACRYIAVFIVFFSIRIHALVADTAILNVFQTLHILENIYLNEYQAYAPDLLTLKKTLGVKDTIEFFVKRHEINVGIRDGKPLLSAISENGDSIVQVGTDTLYTAALNQTDYCIDNTWRINRNTTLIILLHFDPNVDIRVEINDGKTRLCSFESKLRKSRPWKIEGCSQFASIDSDESVPCIKISLPSSIVRASQWQASLWVSSDVNIAGKYFSDKSDWSYPIKGRVSREKTFSISSKRRKGAIK